MGANIFKSGHHTDYEGHAAEQYAEAAKRFMMRDFQNIAEAVGARIEAGKILELSSGPGLIVLEIAKLLKDGSVTGLESSETLLEVARKNVRDIKVDCDINFLKWDTLKMDFPESEFDFIVSNWSIHQFNNPVAVIDEIHRILKPGGQVLLTDIDKNCSDKEIEDATSHAPVQMTNRLKAHRVEFLTLDEYKTIIESSKFERDIELERNTIYWYFYLKKS